jgi:hypothetical protein
MISCCVVALIYFCALKLYRYSIFSNREGSQDAFEMTHNKVCDDGTFIYITNFVNGRGIMTFALIFPIFSFFHKNGLGRYLAYLAPNSSEKEKRAILPTSHPITSESNSNDAFQCILKHQNAPKSTSQRQMQFGGLRYGSRSPLDVALCYFD